MTSAALAYLLSHGTADPPPFPPVPTREQVCGVKMQFRGGLLVESPVYGLMPWYPAALSWCDPVTRQHVYAAMRLAGDRQALIEIPNGLPLYNEMGQFYSPDKFGPLDWTNGETQLDARFNDLVDEVIEEGFTYIINMDERQDHSTRIVQLVMQALSDKEAEYGFTMPGYDSVFPTWPPAAITNWANVARAIKPNCYTGLEHQPGEIPAGNDARDYQPGGAMDGFDVVLGEFQAENSGLHSDTTWQVLGRMIRPYNRPADQPAGDDPHPPFVLTDSPRGPRYYCAWETEEPYLWVRTDPNDPGAVAATLAVIENERAYLAEMGCQYIG